MSHTSVTHIGKITPPCLYCAVIAADIRYTRRRKHFRPPEVLFVHPSLTGVVSLLPLRVRDPVLVPVEATKSKPKKSWRFKGISHSSCHAGCAMLLGPCVSIFLDCIMLGSALSSA